MSKQATVTKLKDKDDSNDTSQVSLLDIEVRCRGLTSIMFNRVIPEELERLRLGEKVAKNAQREKDPRKEAVKKLYVDKEGYPYIPSSMLFATLVNAGKFIYLKGNTKMSTASGTLLPAFMTLLEGEAIRILNPEFPNEPAPWEVDLRPGVNRNANDALVCVVRPRFDIWTFKVHIQIDTAEIGEDKIRTLFDYAGKRIGMGSCRPQRKGVHGQFIVDGWDEISE